MGAPTPVYRTGRRSGAFPALRSRWAERMPAARSDAAAKCLSGAAIVRPCAFASDGVLVESSHSDVTPGERSVNRTLIVVLTIGAGPDDVTGAKCALLRQFPLCVA